jgi:hypothetical protein
MLTPEQSRRAHDIADVCERMIERHLERMSKLPSRQTRKEGEK